MSSETTFLTEPLLSNDELALTGPMDTSELALNLIQPVEALDISTKLPILFETTEPIVRLNPLNTIIPTYPMYTTFPHPLLKRTSLTAICLFQPSTGTYRLYHTGQIALFINCDARIRAGKFLLFKVPDGYLTFANAFNSIPGPTTHRFSTYDPTTGSVIITGTAMTLDLFHINKRQAHWSLGPNITQTPPPPTPTVLAPSTTPKYRILKRKTRAPNIRRSPTPYPRLERAVDTMLASSSGSSAEVAGPTI